MPNPFESSGEWLRCALHAHTTASDGELAPELLVAHYARGGFDALAVTDHWVRTDVPSTDSFVVIPGVELGALAPGGGTAHVLALGVTAALERPEGELRRLEDTVAWVNAHGGVGYLAHPYWSGIALSDVGAFDGIAGLEVYNAGCELEVGQGLGAVHWDAALAAGRRWYGLAVDDCHHPGFDSGHAWTWVRAAEKSAAAVLASLRDGSFYSSTGPAIEELRSDGSAVEVACTPARRITLVAGPGRGASAGAGRLGYVHRATVLAEDARGITAARLAIPPGAPYARLEVHGADGRTAWTNSLV